MRIHLSLLLAVATLTLPLSAQQPTAQQPAPGPKPEDTEVWKPVPKVVTPGATCAAPPSDAIILFDGKNLDEWVSAEDKAPGEMDRCQWRAHRK